MVENVVIKRDSRQGPDEALKDGDHGPRTGEALKDGDHGVAGVGALSYGDRLQPPRRGESPQGAPQSAVAPIPGDVENC
jgi:hypothetical protein